MKTMFKSLSILAVAACAGMSIVSCTADKDLYDPEVIEQNTKAEYAENFIKKFGVVKTNKNWDMSSNRAQLATRGTTVTTNQLDYGLRFDITNNTTVNYNNKFYNDIKNTVLPEKERHEGREAVLLAPGNSFTIFPVSTQTKNKYTMYVKVGDEEEIPLFNKTWENYNTTHVNGMTIDSKKCEMKGLQVDAPAGTIIQIYIKYGNNTLGTNNGHAIFVDAENVKPEGLSKDIMPDNAYIKYVGIEDDPNWGDRDFNDLVIAIIGNPYTPEPEFITEEVTKEIAHPAKRYMIEDLGDTDDFDFNDVVVDVEDIVTQKFKLTKNEAGVILKEEAIEQPVHSQKAFIRAMGGTLDITLKIGTTTWEKKTKFETSKMYNTEAPVYTEKLDTFVVEGWDPDTNNILVTVNGKDNNSTTITFPANGAVPMMMATELSTRWMLERVSIPVEWTE